MPRQSKTDLKKSDFLIIRSKTDNSIVKIISPQHFQVGFDDADFERVVLVHGTIKSTMGVYSPAFSGSLQTLMDGTSYLREGNNVSIHSSSDGSITIAAGTGALVGSLSGQTAAGIVPFTYDGSTNQEVRLDLYTNTGLEINSLFGLEINPSNCSETVVTPAADDYLLIHDASSIATREVAKITVANLMTAANTGPLGNALTFGSGIYDSAGGASSYDNSNAATIAVDLQTDPGLSFSQQKLGILLDGSTISKTVSGLSVANVPFSVSWGTGLASTVGNSYDGSVATTLSIDSTVVPTKGATNIFTDVNTFNNITNGSIIGSIQEVSPGTDYLVAGSNVTITKNLPTAGQITIDAALGAGSALSEGHGISPFSYTGAATATVSALGNAAGGVDVSVSGIGLNATSVSAGGDRNSYVFLSDGGSSITRQTVGTVADLADRSSLVAAKTNGGITVTFPSTYTLPAQFSIDDDGSTIQVGSSGLEVLKVPYDLTQGTGIAAFSFNGSSAQTVGIDTSIVPRKNVVNTFTAANNFSAGLAGSLTHLVDGTTYIREGTNVSISSGSDGAITISAVASAGGIADGNAKYLVLEATGSLSNERVFVPGAGLDTIDYGAGNNFDVFVDLATNPGLKFTSDKLDVKVNPNDTIRKDADGLTVNKVPYGLTQGVGINPFGFDGSSGGAIVAIDGAVVQGRRSKDAYFLSSIYAPFQTVSVAPSDFSDASYDPDLIDIALNGQLLHSGSTGQVTASERDYYVTGASSLKFAFQLEINDIIDVIVYKVVGI